MSADMAVPLSVLLAPGILVLPGGKFFSLLLAEAGKSCPVDGEFPGVVFDKYLKYNIKFISGRMA